MARSRQPLLWAALLCAATGFGPVACGDDEMETGETEAGTTDGGETTEGGATDATETGTSGGEEIEFTPAEGGMRRLMQAQYVDSIALLLGSDAAAAAEEAGLPTDSPLHDFDAIGNAELALTGTGVEDYEAAATAAATAAIGNTTRLATYVPCVADGPQDAACYTEIAEVWGHLAWRRAPSSEEVERVRAIAEAAQEWGEGDFLTGVKYELMAILQSPNFLYMAEVGEPDPEDPTRMRLTSTELITRMSFFLQGRTPDRQLLELAETGGLETEEQIRTVAKHMLSKPAARVALANFYDEALHLRDLPTIGKSPEYFPQFNDELTDAMRQSMLLFVEDLVFELDADARELFSADYAFVNEPLAEIYDVSAPNDGWGPVTMPDAHARAGFLGSAAFLARYAHAIDTSPTRRGNFVLGKFLCAEAPPPPPDVNPNLPETDPDNPVTMKEKLEIHMTDPACSSCHQLMDPIGFALENFDAIGQYRTEDHNGLPIDSFGEVPGFGSFSSPAEIGQVLYEDPRTASCFVANFVRGSMGRLETVGEAEMLYLVEEVFANGGYSLQDLMVELVASPVFRYVSEPSE